MWGGETSDVTGILISYCINYLLRNTGPANLRGRSVNIPAARVAALHGRLRHRGSR